MGAECIWKVRVLRTVEDTIEVSAVTGTEAMERAKEREGIVFVMGAYIGSDDDPDDDG